LPVAVNCWLLPTPTLVFTGVTAIDIKAGVPVTVRVVCAVTEFRLAIMVVGPPARAVAIPAVAGSLLMVATKAKLEAQVTDAVIV
jgi:hypothetical protein